MRCYCTLSNKQTIVAKFFPFSPYQPVFIFIQKNILYESFSFHLLPVGRIFFWVNLFTQVLESPEDEHSTVQLLETQMYFLNQLSSHFLSAGSADITDYCSLPM